MALEEQVVDRLIEKNFHISFAESCTGGMCCGTIVNVTNASKVLDVSFVTYANEAKMKFLGVNADTILSHGVVSEEVACEMAQGLYASGKANLVLSTTGIAGPSSDDSGFPVGLCFIGVGFNGKIGAYRFEFKGSRSEIIENGTKMALFLAIMTIKEL